MFYIPNVKITYCVFNSSDGNSYTRKNVSHVHKRRTGESNRRNLEEIKHERTVRMKHVIRTSALN